MHSEVKEGRTWQELGYLGSARGILGVVVLVSGYRCGKHGSMIIHFTLSVFSNFLCSTKTTHSSSYQVLHLPSGPSFQIHAFTGKNAKWRRSSPEVCLFWASIAVQYGSSVEVDPLLT